MAGYNRTRYVEELLEKTESQPPSFTVHLHPEHWILNNGSKFLYHNQIASLLDDIRAHRIPVDFLDLFDGSHAPFYDGCMIVELLDYRPQRNKEPTPEKPQKTRVILHPNSESLYADICSLNQRFMCKWTDNDALEVESKLLLATAPPLCLDPDPHLTRIANHVLRVSTPTIPMSLKRKAAALEPEEDESGKARRAKIMTFMTPRPPARAHTPSYRFLDAMHNAKQIKPSAPDPPLPPFMNTQPVPNSTSQASTPAPDNTNTSSDSPQKPRNKTETPNIQFTNPTFIANGSHTPTPTPSQLQAPPAPPPTTHQFINQHPNMDQPSPSASGAQMQPQVYSSVQAATEAARRTATPAQAQSTVQQLKDMQMANQKWTLQHQQMLQGGLTPQQQGLLAQMRNQQAQQAQQAHMYAQQVQARVQAQAYQQQQTMPQQQSQQQPQQVQQQQAQQQQPISQQQQSQPSQQSSQPQQTQQKQSQMLQQQMAQMQQQQQQQAQNSPRPKPQQAQQPQRPQSQQQLHPQRPPSQQGNFHSSQQLQSQVPQQSLQPPARQNFSQSPKPAQKQPAPTAAQPNSSSVPAGFHPPVPNSNFLQAPPPGRGAPKAVNISAAGVTAAARQQQAMTQPKPVQIQQAQAQAQAQLGQGHSQQPAQGYAQTLIQQQLFAQQAQQAQYLLKRQGQVSAQTNGRVTPGQSAGPSPARSSPMVANQALAARASPANAQQHALQQQQLAQKQLPQQQHPQQHPQQPAFMPQYNPAHLRPMVHGNPAQMAVAAAVAATGSNAQAAGGAQTAPSPAAGGDGQAQPQQPTQQQQTQQQLAQQYPAFMTYQYPMGMNYAIPQGARMPSGAYWQQGIGVMNGQPINPAQVPKQAVPGGMPGR